MLSILLLQAILAISTPVYAVNEAAPPAPLYPRGTELEPTQLSSGTSSTPFALLPPAPEPLPPVASTVPGMLETPPPIAGAIPTSLTGLEVPPGALAPPPGAAPLPQPGIGAGPVTPPGAAAPFPPSGVGAPYAPGARPGAISGVAPTAIPGVPPAPGIGMPGYESSAQTADLLTKGSVVASVIIITLALMA